MSCVWEAATLGLRRGRALWVAVLAGLVAASVVRRVVSPKYLADVLCAGGGCLLLKGLPGLREVRELAAGGVSLVPPLAWE